ncbi:hypothetical protein [Mycoplasmopsis felis]|uniref:hypothetical protein n=1 Tax=Mycoplasmopsis felis TaxID=33923 RepID=UPI003A5C815D
MPLDNFDVDKLLNIKHTNSLDSVIKTYKIYPNIEGFIENQIHIFLENAINALIVESSFYNAKRFSFNKSKKQTVRWRNH